MKTIKEFMLLILILGLSAGVGFGYDFGLNGNPGDTVAGTIITDEARATYHDTNLNPRDELQATSLNETVTAEYGITFPESDTDTPKSTTRGVPVSWLTVYLNEGNAPFSFTQTSEVSYGGGAAGWVVQTFVTTAEGGRMEYPFSASYHTIPEDGLSTFEAVVTPSTEPTHSPNGSYAIVTTTLTREFDYPLAGTLDFAGVYYFYRGTQSSGDYDSTYGGWNFDTTSTVEANIASPVVTLSRTATVDSPVGYVLGDHDPVPGSLYSVEFIISNEGTGTADDVIVIDKVPANMKAYKFNVLTANESTVEYGFGVDVASDEYLWELYYTTLADGAFERNYNISGGTGWSLAGYSNMTGVVIPSNATYVKWQKGQGGSGYELAPGSYYKGHWSCYIE